MGFVNEVVSDEDIARYNLPFKPGDGRYWTRDRELDCYLWGGIIENFSREYIPEGRFWLFMRDTMLDISLNVEIVSIGSQVNAPKIVWKEVSHIQPSDLGGLDMHEVLSVLRSALAVFGLDGEETRPPHESVAMIQF
ncbi:hypothetical protein [Synechococcus sp. CCAP 1479/9]|uniref:hypothetical protein n=1 Tax=Synechococcus sp. CCAP 1479/9 TaxID=1221593 RepID=UPI001C23FB0F|nr:hypothetical protein [Synechococcus sp. CCAP 1479/9]